jgi:hypothetical protein
MGAGWLVLPRRLVFELGDLPVASLVRLALSPTVTGPELVDIIDDRPDAGRDLRFASFLACDDEGR